MTLKINLAMKNSEMNENVIVDTNDVESQTSYKQFDNQVQAKGILKKTELIDSSKDAAVIMAMKISSTTIILAIMSPIIIADLYFGFTDKSCINNAPENLAISMKLYLLVSGFVSMATMFGFISNICCLSVNQENTIINLCCVSFIIILAGTFHLIWNIIGSIIFWGTIYPEGNCDKNVSTYIFVSLIIKLIGTFIGANNLLSNKKQ
jgi:hypothetical protein